MQVAAPTVHSYASSRMHATSWNLGDSWVTASMITSALHGKERLKENALQRAE